MARVAVDSCVTASVEVGLAWLGGRDPASIPARRAVYRAGITVSELTTLAQQPGQKFGTSLVSVAIRKSVRLTDA